MAVAAGVAVGYLVIFWTMFSLLEPFLGLGYTLATIIAGTGAGTAEFFLMKRSGQ